MTDDDGGYTTLACVDCDVTWFGLPDSGCWVCYGPAVTVDPRFLSEREDALY